MLKFSDYRLFRIALTRAPRFAIIRAAAFFRVFTAGA